ncbi:hypothetical protein WR25_03436 [Diploscapter pachys]|uniref:Uncharacterized protein n=1 Tax=Diploscapter pachys TaxID=2018661 RepID=A0A2A2J7E6_9BILA|nr:hypothetical protein WR25_03436 [Diploscapter pachys]
MSSCSTAMSISNELGDAFTEVEEIASSTDTCIIEMKEEIWTECDTQASSDADPAERGGRNESDSWETEPELEGEKGNEEEEKPMGDAKERERNGREDGQRRGGYEGRRGRGARGSGTNFNYYYGGRNYRNGPRPYRGSGSGLGGGYAVGRGTATRNVIYSHMNTSVEYQQYPMMHAMYNAPNYITTKAYGVGGAGSGAGRYVRNTGNRYNRRGGISSGTFSNQSFRGDSPRKTGSDLDSPTNGHTSNSSGQSSPHKTYHHYNQQQTLTPHLRSMKNNAGLPVYPLIYVSPAGTISIVLSSHAIIETAVDRSLRLVCHNMFAIYMNARGTSSAVIHSKARILHTRDTVYSKFLCAPGSASDKMAVFGANGVLFTMSHLQEAFLVSSDIKGASAVNLDELEFTPLDDTDYSLRLFYKEAPAGEQYAFACDEIITNGTTYERKNDGSLLMNINGVLIRETPAGDIIINHKPRHIECNPIKGTLHMRTGYLDAAVQENDKAFVKKGPKRVHVSRSGMVVSDGNSITSMDQYGRIVSCT